MAKEWEDQTPEDEVGQGDNTPDDIEGQGDQDQDLGEVAEEVVDDAQPKDEPDDPERTEKEKLIEELLNEGLSPDEIRAHLKDTKAAQRKITAQGQQLSEYRQRLDAITSAYQQPTPETPRATQPVQATPTMDDLDEIAKDPVAWAARVKEAAIQSARDEARMVSRTTNAEIVRFNNDMAAIDEMTTQSVMSGVGDAFDEDVAEEAERIYNSDPFYVNGIKAITPEHLRGGAHSVAEYVAGMKKRAYAEALLNHHSKMKKDNEVKARRDAKTETLRKSGVGGIRPGSGGKSGSPKGKSGGIDSFLLDVKARKY